MESVNSITLSFRRCSDTVIFFTSIWLDFFHIHWTLFTDGHFVLRLTWLVLLSLSCHSVHQLITQLGQWIQICVEYYIIGIICLCFTLQFQRIIAWSAFKIIFFVCLIVVFPPSLLRAVIIVWYDWMGQCSLVSYTNNYPDCRWQTRHRTVDGIEIVANPV